VVLGSKHRTMVVVQRQRNSKFLTPRQIRAEGPVADIAGVVHCG
jgi:hypothetical protein